MEFRTIVDIPSTTITISHQDQISLFGSCFAENLGGLLEKNKFRVDINPFGVLYNPASLALSIKKLLRPEKFSPEEIFCYKGIYHSFSHHSRFSSNDEKELLQSINERLFLSSGHLLKSSKLIITFGTAYVYCLCSSGQVVSNCHKLPEKLFDRVRLSVEEIVTEWESVLLSLWEQNPGLNVIFTVSPVRHWKDGAHSNQLSKSTLLLAIEKLQQLFPERIFYFPAYEIIMDELRDYRFYADDMIHPSPIAINYIWKRFGDTYFSSETQNLLKEWSQITKAINHKPFQPDSKEYKDFLVQTLLKTETFIQKFPYFDASQEILFLQSKID